MKINKNVLITGASQGIGKACAILFSQNGYRVFINYNKSENSALNLMQDIINNGGEADIYNADISKYDSVSEMINNIILKFGKIDVLINNAGISSQKLFCDISNKEWNEIIGTNIMGSVNTCKCVLPNMIKNHHGNIINISSIWGICGAAMEVHYSTTKAALIGLTKSLAKELGPSNIRVNCVAPGVINTNMNNNLDKKTIEKLKEDTPLGTIGTPFDIANLCLFLASNKAEFITGQVISPNGGFLI